MAKAQVNEEESTVERAGGTLSRWFRPVTQYFRETRAELRKVTWPTRQESLNLTGLVLAVMVFLSVLLAGLDAVFSRLLDLLFQITGRG